MAQPPSAGTPLAAVLLLVLANLLIPVAILTFGKGFFPYKPLLPGLAQYEDLGYGPPPAAPFDRVIFMVVDALRSDFVYAANSGFQFTQSLIRDGAAVPFTAHATSPTVTMPRIKAITTGSIPSFLDVVLNVDEGDQSSSLASQDTWLAQMKAKAGSSSAGSSSATGKLVLYGDDTWLKLFPETFDRADGTSSFFVSDFTEVDHNVTRHVPAQLAASDWSVTVLHYLGLDHIGHKGGPRSPHMRPKQAEMDGIVRQIYAALASQPHLARTLLVLAGDHGMNDAGNHGASSAGETSPALVFIAPGLRDLGGLGRASPLPETPDFQYYRTVEQSDLAPTLAALLGFPAPKNNLGAFIPDFLPLWPQRRDQAQILMRNAHQILHILTAAFGTEPFAAAAAAPSGPTTTTCAHPQSEVEKLGCAWQALVQTPLAQQDDEWMERTIQWLRDAQDTMSGMASNYNMPLLGVGLAAAVAGLVLAAAASYTILSCSGTRLPSLVPLGLITLLYGIMMFASSYVEEEHHFWYWAATAWLAAVSLRRLSASTQTSTTTSLVYALSTTAALVAVRLVRGWNQTGQKFAGGPDVVKTFLQPRPALLWMLVLGTYLYAGLELERGLRGLGPAALVRAAVASLVVAAFSFKLLFTFADAPELVEGSGLARALVALFSPSAAGSSLVTRARVVFGGVAAAAAAGVYGVKQGRVPGRVPGRVLLGVYVVLGMTQSRTTNIPLFLLFGVVYRFLERQVEQGVDERSEKERGTTERGERSEREEERGTTERSERSERSEERKKERSEERKKQRSEVEREETIERSEEEREETIEQSEDRKKEEQSEDRTAVLGPVEITTATLLLQFAAFFAFGGTNAISSVDLSSAYNGISGFSAAAVGVLLFVGNWAGAIYWGLAGVVLLSGGRSWPSPAKDALRSASASPWPAHIALLTVFAAASVVAVMAACAVLRTHLFVWTVFSPKYLYCAAWTVGMHLGVHVGLGGLLQWIL